LNYYHLNIAPPDSRELTTSLGTYHNYTTWTDESEAGGTTSGETILEPNYVSDIIVYGLGVLHFLLINQAAAVHVQARSGSGLGQAPVITVGTGTGTLPPP